MNLSLSYRRLLKLSSSSVSGDSMPPPSPVRLDFFRLSLNDKNRFPFFSFGDIGKTSPANVALSPGQRGPGLAGKASDLSPGLVAAPSLREPDRFSSVRSLSGDRSLNRLFTLSVLDLLMVSEEDARAGRLKHEKSCPTYSRRRTHSPGQPAERVTSRG